MSDPRVSVIIPTYNRAELIGETIQNIFEQTYSNIELIIVDDGSTDATASVLETYGNRIRWTVQKNAGPAAARNRGIKMATGEIIAFQDSDDAWHPTKIQRQVSLLQRAGESIVCCICNCNIELKGIVFPSFDNAPLKPPIEEGIWLNPTEILATRFVLFNQAVAIRRSALEKVGGFNEALRLMEDVDLGLRLSFEGPWSFIREPLATRQAKFAHTLGSEATPQITQENEVYILESALSIIERTPKLSHFDSIIRHELQRSRRVLKATQSREKGSPWSSVIGSGRLLFERYLMGIERRMPGFPEMKVAAVDPETTVVLPAKVNLQQN
jgi:glycosyltransferase involved in cell wall biosynthesis